jgi:hypothetical protein
MSDPTKLKPAELKINLYTNIPKGDDYDIEPLTFDKISSPDLKIDEKIKPTQNPYFTYQFKYDESNLSRLTYSDVVKTFFIRNDFINKLGRSNESYLPLDPPTDEAEKKKYLDKRTKVINNNIMLMLKYLLPTRFPVINNHFNSMDLIKGVDSLSTLLYNPFSTRKPIYLKLSGGTFTLKKIIWLNDVVNNPVYKKMIKLDKPINISGKSSNNDLEAFLVLTRGDAPTKRMADLKRCYKTKCSDNESRYTGVQILSSELYEIYVDVELFENELKPEDEGNVKCPYYGDYLGEELEKILKDMEVNIAEEKLKGELKKNALFSVKTMTSRKQEAVKKEDELDEKTRAKKKEEETKYNELPPNIRNNYELIAKGFFDKLDEGKLKSVVKKYDINYRNYYIDFLSDENSEKQLGYLIEFITNNDNVGKKFTDKDKFLKLYTYIISRIEEYSGTNYRYKSQVEKYPENKAKFEIAKELLESLSNNETLTLAKQEIKDNEEYEDIRKDDSRVKIYDSNAKIFFNRLLRDKKPILKELQNNIKKANITYKNYYLNFLRDLEVGSPEDMSLFIAITTNKVANLRERGAIDTHITTEKGKTAKDDIKTLYYEIASEWLKSVETGKSGGKTYKKGLKRKNNKKKYTRKSYH